MRPTDFQIGDEFQIKGPTYPKQRFRVAVVLPGSITCTDVNERGNADRKTLYTFFDVNLKVHTAFDRIRMLKRAETDAAYFGRVMKEVA